MLNKSHAKTETVQESASPLRLNLICALNCEAKSLIDKLRLKKQNQTVFSTYVGHWGVADQSVLVTVLITGVGAMSMAAGVAWLAAVQNEKYLNSVWLNVGTAGHGEFKLGAPFIVSMSQGVFSSRRFYPPQVARRAVRLSPCMSLNAPSSDYPETGGIDMEASAFFDVACRFTQAELVQSFKVVSDTPSQGIEHLTANIIAEIMQPHTEAVLVFSKALLLLAENAVQKPNNELVMPQIRATHSQRQQLNDRAKRLAFSLPAEKIDHLSSELLRLSQSVSDEKKAANLLLNYLDTAILNLQPTLHDSLASATQKHAQSRITQHGVG